MNVDKSDTDSVFVVFCARTQKDKDVHFVGVRLRVQSQ